MAHLIDNTGTDILTAHMIYCEKWGTPWWGGGARVPELFNVQFLRDNAPAIAAPVAKVPSHVKVAKPDGGSEWIPTGMNSLVRIDVDNRRHVVGNCTPTWEFSHHLDDLQAFLDGFGKPDENLIDTAGGLLSFERFFAGLYLGNGFQVKGDDRVDLRVTFTTGYTGQARKAYITATRPVCANTVRLGELNAESMIIARHTKNGLDKLRAGAKALGIIDKAAAEFAEMCRAMSDTELNGQQMRYFFDEVFPVRGKPVEPTAPVPTGDDAKDFQARLIYQEQREAYAKEMEKYDGKRSTASQELDTVLLAQPGYDGSGSLWQAFNAVTYLVDHKRDVRGSKDDSAQVQLDKRIIANMLDGGGQDVKDRALALAGKILRV